MRSSNLVNTQSLDNPGPGEYTIAKDMGVTKANVREQLDNGTYILIHAPSLCVSMSMMALFDSVRIYASVGDYVMSNAKAYEWEHFDKRYITNAQTRALQSMLIPLRMYVQPWALSLIRTHMHVYVYIHIPTYKFLYTGYTPDHISSAMFKSSMLDRFGKPLPSQQRVKQPIDPGPGVYMCVCVHRGDCMRVLLAFIDFCASSFLLSVLTHLCIVYSSYACVHLHACTLIQTKTFPQPQYMNMHAL